MGAAPFPLCSATLVSMVCVDGSAGTVLAESCWSAVRRVGLAVAWRLINATEAVTPPIACSIR